MIRRILVILVWLVIHVPASYAQTDPVVWVVGSMERVGRFTEPGTNADITLYAARGEYEAFQIAVQGELAAVRLTISDLRSDDRAVISAQHVQLYQEHYVEVKEGSPNWGGSNQPLGPGWYADALIPLDPASMEPVDVPAGENLPFWVDIEVPRDAAPETYHGTYHITSAKGEAAGSITLHVWDFELPLRPSMYSSFLFQYPARLEDKIELLKHKVMPAQIDPSEQQMLIEEWGLNAVNLSYWSGADVSTCAMDQPLPSVAELEDVVQSYSADLLIYNLTADEIDRCITELTTTLDEWAQHLHAAGVLQLVTLPPMPELYERSLVDIWVLLPVMYDAALEPVADVMAKGNQVWFYTAQTQDDYSPKWEIDFAPINYRIPGMIMQSLGITGMLYWAVDWWIGEPWSEPLYRSDDGTAFPGEGVLVYPGEAVGIDHVVPSLRLKWIREGVEDYEYVALLKNFANPDEVLSIIAAAGSDWSNWTQDPQVLETVRRDLGDRIEEAQKRE